jgi:hypothetical protein
MPTCTQAAHDVKPYTNTSGKYVIVLQQRRSTLRAHARRRMFRGGDEGGEGDPNVAMLSRPAAQGMRRAGGARNTV